MFDGRGSPRRPWRRALACATILFGALCFSAMLLDRASTAAAQSGPAVYAEPERTEVQTGAVFTIGVAARDVVDLMAFQFTMQYDPGVLRFHQALVGPFLGSTGRRVMPLGPVTDTGRVSFGATSFPGSPGPSGGGTLALVSFSAERPGESEIGLGRILMTDTQNRPITVTAVTGGLVTVSGAPLGWPHLYLPSVKRD